LTTSRGRITIKRHLIGSNLAMAELLFSKTEPITSLYSPQSACRASGSLVPGG
jgi:hypothetical protein